MQPVQDGYATNYRTITVKMKDGTEITGKLNIGEFARVSDLFRQNPVEYIVLAEAEHRGGSGKVVILNRREIVWAEPHED